jgi:uncharacterized protein (DUF58 family)
MMSLSRFWKKSKSPEPAQAAPGGDSLRELLRRVRRIEITTRKAVNEVFAGEYHSVFKGRGIEFLEVREYYPGDEIRTIDWNVTARMGAPFVKVFAEERELTVILMVDASNSLRFGTVDKEKSELAAELCALFSFSAIKNNDRVGLIIFTDRIERYVPPRKGSKNALRLIREVLGFKPERKATDLSLAMDFLFRVQKRKAVVILISDFLAEGYEEKLKVARKKYDLIALTLGDPREREIPSLGLVELEDAETGQTMVLDSSEPAVREYFAKSFEARRKSQADVFRKAEVDSIPIFTGENFAPALVKFFRGRARRAAR